ncbi:IclR family transcriptional regulator [Streptomyces sp. CSDS2]|uniref:IclR family transcriptional regulator n=1 Tax=Streptomyces sp. CSDS2 TaxID=3055051 RepID=UPI0025B1C966|nr:IclR family transcriptional regulator [Streptomyces sp. CSDS2]MDN3258958.1 IclR family transcriptional regulator [Streptomyces sp. CSDS2]
MVETDSPRPHRVQSVARAFALLEAVGAAADGVRLSDAAESVGLSRSTAHNLLATLESLGYVTQRSSAGRYILTERLTELARGSVGSDDALRDMIHPVLDKLASISAETCYLAVPALRDYVYIDTVESSQPLKLAVPVGGHDPFFGTAIGHVLLAFRPATAERLAREQPEEWARWQEHVAAVHELGYAVDIEDYQPGLCCAAVPVRRHGRVVAALGVSGPASRLPQDRLRELAITASHLLRTEGIG